MKQVIIACFLLVLGAGVRAQFSSGNLHASGLTCALCTKAINTSLEQISFVESVKADIKTSSFNIVFKPGAKVDIDALRKGVEDAGFSVAKLQVTAALEQVGVEQDAHVELNGQTFHFLDVKKQVLTGPTTLTVVDKHFLPSKAFKKYSKTTKMACVETGKMESCCTKSSSTASSRIYHLTL